MVDVTRIQIYADTDQTMEVTLGTNTFNLTLYYSQEFDGWSADVFDVDRNIDVIKGQPVLIGQDIFNGSNRQDIGYLIVEGTSADSTEASSSTLSTAVKLLWYQNV